MTSAAAEVTGASASRSVWLACVIFGRRLAGAIPLAPLRSLL
jgi:hypothetical protein